MRKKKKKKIKWLGPFCDKEHSKIYVSNAGAVVKLVKCPCGKCSQDWHSIRIS